MSERITICSTLRHISEPFNNAETVELKFVIPACGKVQGGDVTLRVDAADRHLYMDGDKCMVQLTIL